MTTRPAAEPCPAAPVFAFLLALYVATASGHFYLHDDEVKLLVARAWIDRGTCELSTRAVTHVIAPDGRAVSPWAPGTSALMVPAVIAGRAVARAAGFDPFLAHYVVTGLCCFTTAVFAALAGSLVAALALALGATGRAALLAGLAYGLTTPNWPHSKTVISEVPASALLALAFLAAARWRGAVRGGSPATRLAVAHGAAAGAALGAASWFVYPALLLGPVLVGWILVEARASGLSVRAAGLAVASLVAGLGLALVPSLAYNAARFGHPLVTGYGNLLDRAASVPTAAAGLGALGLAALLWAAGRGRPAWSGVLARTALVGLLLGYLVFGSFEGFYRQFFSPSDGIVFYCPALVLLGWGVPAALRRDRTLSLALVGGAVAHALFVSSDLRSVWSWGSRYVVPALPLAFALLSPLLEPSRRPWRPAVVGAVLGLGLCVQLVGVVVSHHVEKDRVVHRLIDRLGIDARTYPYEMQMSYDVDQVSIRRMALRALEMRTWGLPSGPVRDPAAKDAVRGTYPDLWWAHLAVVGAPRGAVLAALGVAWLLVIAAAWPVVRFWRRAPAATACRVR